ncbi:hypothetical protein BOTBODRAFT_27577 [Botryobasidium botryosum FD-172 SS1]|uniref:Uncharacterized protein n=1 Tax=Botryobasidium botryosum (strain FD-172 SS1) TaxID=930990 RepID=A0A067MZN4_BOTB1|nr:hypothetical protein BOTBODRAFT_27577 [Botryobasidium botryosum FD-172 SS1]
MLRKNQDRLYITLQHRMARPGFHWALMLSPKSESSDTTVEDSHIFHVLNTIQAGVPVGPSGHPDWRFEDKPTNSLSSGRLVARILVAKMPSSVPLETRAKDIAAIVRTVPLVQGNPEWRCRVWAQEALVALRSAGGDFATVPQVTSGGQIESDIMAFGDKSKEAIMKGKGLISHASELPCLDMRVR